MPEKPQKVGAVLVIGAGVAGIQSSLDLANSGFKVYLLDRGLSVGGVMTQLDKTFPTNDCAMCILGPKLVDVGRHENIQIITKAQLDNLEGDPGRFKVKIRKLPRYVIEDKCTGCGKCVEECPVTNWANEFEGNLTNRKAIYRPFPQAIPNIFAIDKKGLSPCRANCPAGVNAQGYIALISQGKFKEAWELIREACPFPGVCGRICHHPCEDKCNRGDLDEPLAIASLKRFVADYIAQVGEDKPSPPSEKRLEKIAIIGSGPAGLTAAHDLAKRGYPVTVLEALSEPGGMMRVGVPEYRLPRRVLAPEIDYICHLGVKIKTNTPIGKELTLDDLKKQGYQAIFIATGAHKSQKLSIEGVELEGVIEAVPFLRDLNLGEITADVFQGERVTVIGGGNVALDTARSALRLGAKEVHLVCLEARDEMPAQKWEIVQALGEGVQLHCSLGGQRIIDQKGKVAGVECLECSSVFDEKDRFNPSFRPGTESIMETDKVIIAIGQECDLSFTDGEKIEVTPQGTIAVDPVTLSTQGEGVFAGGDVVIGPASVVEAIAGGHQAAESIDRYLRGEDLKEGREQPKVETAPLPQFHVESRPRQKMPVIPSRERIENFEEFELGFTEQMAIEEAKRCLNCGGCAECFQCIKACEEEAINHQMWEEEIELEVGSIILALGFDKFNPQIKKDYGYGVFPNVITSTEFERILSASGPYQGEILRPSDRTHPQKIAFVQCVGSRDTSGEGEREYCSSVCCMSATKEAIIAQEHIPDLETHIYFMDMRALGKGFEDYYQKAQERYQVIYRRCRISLIENIPGSDDLWVNYSSEGGQITRDRYDLVVLSVGLTPPRDIREISQKLDIQLNEYGFIKTDSCFLTQTTRPGVYCCGACTGPKNIAETVCEASAAAAEVQALLREARGTKISQKVYPPEINVSNEDPRIGVFVCQCGTNIAGSVNVPQVVRFATNLPYVVYAESNPYTCSQDTQQKIREKIKEHQLNRIVVASCTPRTHEQLFQETIREAGLNRYLFEMANIREQCSWVHLQSKDRATEKAQQLVRVAVAKAELLIPIKVKLFPVTARSLVIGGGLSGMMAALSLAEQGFRVYLVEKEKNLGGNLRHLHYTLRGINPQRLLQSTREKIRQNELITTYTEAEVKEVSGYVGNFEAVVYSKEEDRITLKHGAIIVATGAEYYRPEEYSYGDNEKVVTQRELEDLLSPDAPRMINYQNIVMIQCVGSRCEERKYCSRVCCSEAIKNALKVRDLCPKTNIYILYKDVRTYGFQEKYYRYAREKGILFIRYDDENKPQVTVEKDIVSIRFRDHIIGKNLRINADLLVLSAGIVPGETNAELAKILKLPLTEDKFFMEAHPKLRPLEFATEGVFLCGLAHSPRSIEESICQAKGAAAKAAVLLSQEEIEAKAMVVSVKSKLCTGCGRCVAVCPYDAREIDEETGVAQVKEVLCQGCGACVAACPNGAILQPAFGKRETIAALEGALW